MYKSNYYELYILNISICNYYNYYIKGRDYFCSCDDKFCRYVKVRHNLFIFVSLLLISTQSALSIDKRPRSCGDLLSQYQSKLHQKLLSSGYSNSVATRILNTRPDIAKEIAKRLLSGDKSGNAIKVYRGVAVEPKEFKVNATDLSRNDASHGSEKAHTSPELRISLFYVERKKNDFGTIIEFELPEYLGVKKGTIPPKNDRPFEILFDNDKIPDFRPFITRIGVINVKKGPQHVENSLLDGYRWSHWTEDDIQWFNYEDIFINGVPTNPSIIPDK